MAAQFIISTQNILCFANFCVSEDTSTKEKIKVHYPWQIDFTQPHCGGDFSPDNQLICSGSGTRVHVFDSITGREITTYNGGHRSQVTKVKFSTCGHMIISVDREGCVSLWKAPSKTGTMPRLKKCSGIVPVITVNPFIEDP